jgi:hypothetical protein
MTMHKRSTMAILAALLLSTCMAFSQNPNSGNPHGQGSLAVPVAGQFSPSGTTGPLSSLGSGTMAGTFNVQKFAVQNDAQGKPQLVAIGNLIATLTPTAGAATTAAAAPAASGPTTVVMNNVAVPLAATGTCPILTLTLGPLHLDLLGLVVDIPNPINLNIVAQSGPGNLLGNLLCAVTNLLNGGGALSQIANALNQILAALGL